MVKIEMKEKKDITLEEGCNEYIMNCIGRNLREGTIKHYEDSIKQILKYIDGNIYVKDMNKKIISDFIIALRKNPKLNDTTIYTYSRDLKTLMYYFMRCKYIPTFQIKLTKGNKKNIETYNDEELRLLLKKPNLKYCSFTEYKSWVIINFLLSTGVRQNSLINIKIKDIDFDNELLQINVTKNRKPLILPMNKDIKHILKEYLKYRRGEVDDYLFCNVYGRKLVKSTLYHEIYKYNLDRGLEKTGLHRFRHTFAKKWVIMGGNVVTLQKILAHSSLSITQNYLNILTSDLKKDMDQYNILSEFRQESIKIR